MSRQQIANVLAARYASAQMTGYLVAGEQDRLRTQTMAGGLSRTS